MLSDGEDTASKIEFHEILTKLKNNKHINLIIVGLGLCLDDLDFIEQL